MRHRGSFVITVILAALPLYACAGSEEIETDSGTPTPTEDGGAAQPMTSAQVHANVRDAFVAEAEWMRIYGASVVDRGADAQAAFSRLNESEARVAQQVGALAGDANGAQLATLLQARANAFASAVGTMTAAAAPVGGEDPQAALDANAQQISDFFSSLLPNAFPSNAADNLKNADRSMIAGVQAHASGDDATAVADFDVAQVADANFADDVSAGLATAFNAELAPATTSLIQDALALRLQMILSDQAFWMRAFVVDQMQNRTAQPELDRAVKATVDFGELVTAYFGQASGSTAQYDVHTDTTDAIAFLYALESGDQGAVDGIGTQWNGDAETLAQFLAQIMSIDEGTVQQLLETNVDRERAMIVARSQSQWNAEATDFENVVDDRNAIATSLAAAIALKFSSTAR